MAKQAYYEYEAMSGDTWDAISLDFFDTEYYSEKIMEFNQDYRRVLVFSGGEKLKVPVIQVEPASTLPPWKRGV